MKLKRIGIDLAKQVFQVHGVDSHEQAVCRKQLKRSQMLDFFRQLEPCLIAMEACAGKPGGRPYMETREAIFHQARYGLPRDFELSRPINFHSRLEW